MAGMTKDQETTDKPNAYIAFFILFALYLILVLAQLFSPEVLFENLSAQQQNLTAFRDQYFLMLVLIYVLAYALMVAFSLPGATIGTLAGGFLFGLFLGTLMTVFAASLGATLLFIAIRAGIGRRLAMQFENASGRIKKVKRAIDENQWSMLFFIRFVPIVPFFVANILPALLNVPLRRFVITTFIGIIPGSFVYTSIGVGMSQLLARGEIPDLGVIFEAHILLPLLGLAALSLLPILLKRFAPRLETE